MLGIGCMGLHDVIYSMKFQSNSGAQQNHMFKTSIIDIPIYSCLIVGPLSQCTQEHGFISKYSSRNIQVQVMTTSYDFSMTGRRHA